MDILTNESIIKAKKTHSGSRLTFQVEFCVPPYEIFSQVMVEPILRKSHRGWGESKGGPVSMLLKSVLTLLPIVWLIVALFS